MACRRGGGRGCQRRGARTVCGADAVARGLGLPGALAQEEPHAAGRPREREDRPRDALPELRGDRSGAGVGDAPADAEQHAAEHVAARRLLAGVGQRCAGQRGAVAHAAQDRQADRRGQDRRGEHEVQVGLLEQQGAAEDVGARHAAPAQRDAEDEADERAGDAGGGHR
jgi:hypothetical protein